MWSVVEGSVRSLMLKEGGVGPRFEKACVMPFGILGRGFCFSGDLYLGCFCAGLREDVPFLFPAARLIQLTRLLPILKIDWINTSSAA